MTEGRQDAACFFFSEWRNIVDDMDMGRRVWSWCSNQIKVRARVLMCLYFHEVGVFHFRVETAGIVHDRDL